LKDETKNLLEKIKKYKEKVRSTKLVELQVSKSKKFNTIIYIIFPNSYLLSTSYFINPFNSLI